MRIERHDGWRDHALSGTIWGALRGFAIGMILDRAVGCGALCYLSAPIGAGLGFHVGHRTINLQWTPVTFAELDIERIQPLMNTDGLRTLADVSVRRVTPRLMGRAVGQLTQFRGPHQ